MIYVFDLKKGGAPEEYLDKKDLRTMLDDEYPDWDSQDFENNIFIVEGRDIIVDIEPRVLNLLVGGV